MHYDLNLPRASARFSKLSMIFRTWRKVVQQDSFSHLLRGLIPIRPQLKFGLLCLKPKSSHFKDGETHGVPPWSGFNWIVWRDRWKSVLGKIDQSVRREGQPRRRQLLHPPREAFDILSPIKGKKSLDSPNAIP